MALVVNDRVREESTTTGTGTLTLTGAVAGFETFSSAIGNTNTTYYAIQNQDVPTEFEVGLGTVGAGTLSRDTILSSSNSDAAVNFSAGTKDVFCTLPASKAVILDSSGNIVANNGSNLTNLNASNLASGTVDNARLDADLAAIGGLTSAADKGIQFTGSGTAGTFDLTTAGKALLDDADAAAQRTTLGLGSIATLNTVTLTTDTTGDYVASITAGEGITGAASGEGSTPTLAVDLNELTTSTADADGDFFAVVDSVGAQKKLTKGNIAISGFNNDSGFIDGSSLNADNLSSGTVPDARFPATLPAISGANLTSLNATNIASGTLSSDRLPTVPTTKGGTGLTTIGTANQVLAVNSGGTALEYQTPTTGDITGVTAGNGLTGGGTTGDVTLNVGAGALIDVTADAIDVDLSELTTSTSDADGDFFVVVDSVNAQKKLTKANIAISGFNNDSGFIDGSSLNASNLSSGTVPDARFPATLPAISGANLTNLDASDLASGTVPIARIDLNLLTTSTSDGDGDFFVVVDSVGAEKKLTKANINISGFNNNSGFTTNTGTVTSVGVSAGVGLSGGGTITTSGTVTLTVDLSELTDMTDTMVGTDEFIVLDAGADRRKAANEIGLSIFNNDAGFTTNTGDITAVTAGSGLTGGGTTGDVTLNVGAGTGIDVAADTIAVDVSDFMTNGVNNRVVTATGTDAMNAEANMTFDGTDLSIPQNIVHLGDTNCYIGFHATDQWRVVTNAVERFEVNNTTVSVSNATLDVNGTLIADKGYVPEATLTDGATIAWNMSTQSVAKVTLAGNRTVAAPTNGSSGQFASLLVIQDGTGSRTLTWNAVYEFAADTAPTLSTTGGKADLFVFRYNGTKWLEVGRNLLLTVV
jgi:hypothetical protein